MKANPGPWTTVFSQIWQEISKQDGYTKLNRTERDHLEWLLQARLQHETDRYLERFDAKRDGDNIVTTPHTPDHQSWSNDAEKELVRTLLRFNLRPLIGEWIVNPEPDRRDARRG
jgi:hypothetical protein